MSEPFPIVKLELQHARHQICHAFNQYADDLKERVEAVVKQAVDDFDIAREFEGLANACLRETINQTLKNSFAALSWRDDMQSQLTGMFIKALQEKKYFLDKQVASQTARGPKKETKPANRTPRSPKSHPLQ